MPKRITPSWDEYFMRIVDLTKIKSKDRSTQVGCMVVKEEKIPLVMGYNGFPRGVSDDIDKRHERPIKYLFTEHAERNAIYAAARNGISLLGTTMYITGLPCADCARAIIQSGIKYIVVPDRPFEGKGDWKLSCQIGWTMMMESNNVGVIFLDEQYKRIHPVFATDFLKDENASQ